MALSRSDRAVEAPCIAFPPAIVTLVLGAGEAFLDDCAEDFLDGDKASEIKLPAADGGGLLCGRGPAESVIKGICVASGAFSCKARLSATCCLRAGLGM